MHNYILGIDPGTTETAYCLCTVNEKQCVGDKPLSINQFAKLSNDEMVEVLHTILQSLKEEDTIRIAIEHLESYGTAVGKSTFETAYFIGRLKEITFTYALNSENISLDRIYRHEEKMRICHSMKANDASIKQSLVDRFADDPSKNHGKGSKKTPDYFYGFKADCWSAFAICFTEYCKQNHLEE